VTMLLIALGAGLGAPARYLTDRAIQARRPTLFPWGTVLVNVLACVILGVVVGAGSNATVTALVGSGFCGALSTYSAFGYETFRLNRPGTRRLAAGNVAVSLVAGIAATALGWWLGVRLR
jgi:CrcB protein